MARSITLKIKRQDSPQAKSRWEEFELTWKPGMNVISAMMEIARNPVTREGKPTTAIAYDSNCLEEVCGSCAMLINGKARMACSALVDKLDQPIRVEPLSKFPLVRDLTVDRSVIYTIWVQDRVCILPSRKRHIPSHAAFPAVAAWKPARNSTNKLGLLGQQRLRRSAFSTSIPRGKRLSMNGYRR